MAYRANQWTPLAKRFWDRVNTGPGCWEWTGPKYMAGGYGRLALDKRQAKAHRVSWELHYGPIPPGMYVCHKCDNPPCVRPDHLFLGTHGDNARDAFVKGRLHSLDAHRRGPRPAIRGENHWTHRKPEGLRRGAANSATKLTEDKVREIRWLHAGGQSANSLGKQFGVTHQSILALVKRETWKHVD